MKLKLTGDLFKRLLAREDMKPKYSITIDMKKVSKADLEEKKCRTKALHLPIN